MHKAVLPTLLAATTLLAVAGCGDDSGSTVTTPPTTSSAATTTTPSSSPAVQQFRITVKDGKATGDTGELKVTRNVPFQVIVTSDVADEVHVHSETRAGFPMDVEAGGTVTVDVVEKVAGQYDVELEGRKLLLATLEVR